MSVSLEQLRRARPALLREVATVLVIDRLLLEQVLAQLVGARVLAVRWTGLAAAAASGESARLVGGVRAMCVALSASEAALLGAADSLEAVKALVRKADRLAAAAGGWIDLDGRVHLPPRLGHFADPVMAAVGAREEERVRWQVERLLDQALATAHTADRELARALTAAVADNACFVSPPSHRVLSPPLASASRPAEVLPFATAAWWQSLSDPERAWVVREHPEWVGPRDGVPAGVRHAANLVLLARAERDAATAFDDVVSGRDARADALLGVGLQGSAVGLAERQRVDDLRAVRDVMTRDDGAPRQLLLVDASGPLVRAAVAVGDVEAAEHVTTFVGGLGTTARNDLRRYDSSFAAKRDKAGRLGGGADLAIVTWMGYPAPQPAEVLSPGSRSVLSDRLARDHGAALAAFVNGIDAARVVSPHQTLWAHSYGSVVGGHALLENSGLDDVVLFGSPGVAFSSLWEAGLKPGSLNVLRADRDLVAVSGWHLTDPAHIDGASVLSTSWTKPSGLNGGLPSVGHSAYLDPGSTSEHNLLAVAIGRPDLRVHASR